MSAWRAMAISRIRRLLSDANPTKRDQPLSLRNVAVFALLALAVLFALTMIVRAVVSPLSSDTAHDHAPAGTESEAPGESSAEAGFARDMMVHHAQAVEMAEIVREKTESQDIKILARDIALTQQAQIGMMQGWLQVWGLPPTSTEPAMSWMGHPTEGRMPGMASPQEISELQKASPEEAEVLFLQLMIPHHEAALPMAEAVLEETSHEEVEQLATAIAASQEAEIHTMQEMLQRLGVPVEGEQPTSDAASHGAEEHDHDGHEHDGTPSESHGESDTVPAETPTGQEMVASIVHGATQGATAFLVGLVAFAALVWLPTSRVIGYGQDIVGVFVLWIWGLIGLLVVAGAVELSLYAVRASGGPFSLGLLGQALFDTRVGTVWLVRLALGLLTALAATRAVRSQRSGYRHNWWDAAVIGGALLLATLTLTSHAAAEGGFVPFLADWLHGVAASVWVGGLLGFPLVLLGPMRAVTKKQRATLLWRAVRRFSKMATLAVMVLILTGAYAVLLHVPSVEALLGTAYGRALMVKLGLAVFLFAAGGANLVLGGRGPFGRIVGVELILAVGVFVATGFLTSLPPATGASP